MHDPRHEAITNKGVHLPKVWRWIMSGFLMTFILLTGFGVYINLRWKPYLTRHIKEAIITSTDSLYNISFESVNVDVLTGKVSFKKIAFIPNVKMYQRMIRRGAAPRHLFIVEVAGLDIERVHPFQVYFRRELELTSLVINRPKVRMIYHELPGIQSTMVDNRNAYQRLSKYLRSIKVDVINFHDSDFQYIDQSVKRNQVTRLKNLDINIEGLLIDSASQYDRSKFYHTQNISVLLQNYSYRTPDEMYDVEVDEFMASTRSQNARVRGFRLIPRYGEMDFSRKLNARAGRYGARVNEALLEDINFKAFNRDRRLIASRLTISNSNLNIFLNKAIPKKADKRLMSFPQLALRQMTLNTLIDSVVIQNGRIAYSEYSPQTKMKGMIFFDHIEGSIYNITNDSAALASNRITRAGITGLIMGRGRMNAALEFDLTNKAAAFDLKGSVGNMDGELVNKVLKPLTLVEIREGFIEQMQFAITGDTLGVRGRLALKYNDLKISLLARNEKARLRKMNLASIAANVLVLKNENPSPGEKLRHANVLYSRPDSVSFVTMIWKGMLGGLKETIGLDPQTQRKIEVKVLELKTIKEEREERREERLRRKEQRKQKERK
ncbi:hypothetical protein GZH53_10690 [Flavihumibacter sp. R14]|nr:hypothetical protein [Flavihumibacter soli]